MTEVHDFVVIGGGPAGLAAATLGAELGLETVLFDEQPAPGGQIYRAVEAVARDRPADLAILGDDYGRGRAIAEGFRRSGAAYAPETTVWEVTRELSIGVSGAGAARIVRAKRLLVAAGAMERPLPFPGWTLPGVMGVGAAQTLLKAGALVPDVPTVVAGSGPLVPLVAWQLLRAGAPPRAILSTTPRRNYRAAASSLPAALLAGSDLWKGLGWMRAVRRAGITRVYGVDGLRAEGDGRLAAVGYRTGGTWRTFEARLLLTHEGIVPNAQLSLALGLDHEWDAVSRYWRPVVDAWGGTAIDGIALAGDCAGINGARAAIHQGRLAALEAARQLGRISTEARDRRAAPERRALRRQRPVRRFLDLLFRPNPALLPPPDDATIVCRCEEITAGEIRRVVALGCPGPNQAKAFTRCGMGPCQGRLCGLTVSELMAEARGVTVPEVGRYRVRPPVKPVTVGELAGLQGLEREVRIREDLPTGGRGS
jgi:NADPH-dependent 2,4-dienoyl-CoA reductase/sulfur reductase-like enzyme